MEEIEIKQDIRVGLDVSTKTIGICMLLNDGSEYGKIIELTHIQPKISKRVSNNKNEILFLKVEIFRNEFLKKYQGKQISQVYIEEPLVNSNNAETVSTLLRFNGMISLAVYEEWGITPTYISSYEARKYSFPDLMSIRKYGKNGQLYEKKKIISSIKKNNLVLFGAYPWDVEKKSVIQERVAEIFPDITWIYDKNNKLKDVNFDATDAYVALLGSLNKERYGELEMNVSNITENNKKAEFDVKYWNKTEHKTIYLD